MEIKHIEKEFKQKVCKEILKNAPRFNKNKKQKINSIKYYTLPLPYQHHRPFKFLPVNIKHKEISSGWRFFTRKGSSVPAMLVPR